MSVQIQLDKSFIQKHAISMLTEFGRKWDAIQIAELVDMVSNVSFHPSDAAPISEKLDDQIWFAIRKLERKWA